MNADHHKPVSPPGEMILCSSVPHLHGLPPTGLPMAYPTALPPAYPQLTHDQLTHDSPMTSLPHLTHNWLTLSLSDQLTHNWLIHHQTNLITHNWLALSLPDQLTHSLPMDQLTPSQLTHYSLPTAAYPLITHQLTCQLTHCSLPMTYP